MPLLNYSVASDLFQNTGTSILIMKIWDRLFLEIRILMLIRNGILIERAPRNYRIIWHSFSGWGYFNAAIHRKHAVKSFLYMVLTVSLIWNQNIINMFIIFHYSDVIMGAMASQITNLTIVYSTVYSGADQRKHQRSALLAFVWGIHRWPVKSPHKWPVTRKMLPFDDVIMLRKKY